VAYLAISAAISPGDSSTEVRIECGKPEVHIGGYSRVYTEQVLELELLETYPAASTPFLSSYHASSRPPF